MVIKELILTRTDLSLEECMTGKIAMNKHALSIEEMMQWPHQDPFGP
jgi:hypothetical protein